MEGELLGVIVVLAKRRERERQLGQRDLRRHGAGSAVLCVFTRVI